MNKPVHGKTKWPAHPGICLALALIGLHCEHAGPLEFEVDDTPTLAEVQNKIFSTSCAVETCHAGPNALMGLDLSSDAAYENLVGVASAEVPDLLLVKPGDPDDSYLVVKIEGGSRLAAGTFKMPLGRDPLSDEEIAMVRAWIAAGAQDD